MKLGLVTILTFLSVNSLASNLRCVSSQRSDDRQVALHGQAARGETLTVSVHNQGRVRQIEILVNQIKPFNDHVEINGFAKNIAFIGGGQMEMQLVLPFKNINPAHLRTMTPVFNSGPFVEEYEMACAVQNLYQIPPNQPILQTL